MKIKIKKGFKVKVLSGSYRGKEGVVIKSSIKSRVAIVEGINLKKKTNKQDKKNSSNVSSNDNFTYISHPIKWDKLEVIN